MRGIYMKYNSISRRRQKRRQTFDRVLMGVFLALVALIFLALIIAVLWLLISAADISINAPSMAGQAPVYWEYNLIVLLTGK
jgi:cell division septal protein FtsQ